MAIRLVDMRSFVEVVFFGSISEASRRLNETPANLSARINKLENQLGFSLLNRSTRSLSATSEGEQFFDTCLRILDEFEAFKQSTAADDQIRGPLSVTCSHDFGGNILEPILADFVQINPGIQLDLRLSDKEEDLVQERIHLAIRNGPVDSSALVAQRLCQNQKVVVASPAYIEEMGIPSDPEELKNHKCLLVSARGERAQSWTFHSQTVVVSGFHISNDSEMVKRWAVKGYGIAMKNKMEIKKELAKGSLVQILQEHEAAEETIYAVYPNRFVPRRVSQLVEFLKVKFGNMEDKKSPQKLWAQSLNVGGEVS